MSDARPNAFHLVLVRRGDPASHQDGIRIHVGDVTEDQTLLYAMAFWIEQALRNLEGVLLDEVVGLLRSLASRDDDATLGLLHDSSFPERIEDARALLEAVQIRELEDRGLVALIERFETLRAPIPAWWARYTPP